MPSVSHAFGNLYHSVAEILGGLLNSILAVFQSIFALAVNTVEAFFAILRALFTGVVDLMSSAVGFVIGASTVQLALFLRSSSFIRPMLAGNIFILTVLGAAYWFFATRTQQGRVTHQDVKAKLKR